jgi:hypothetical protein
MITKTGLVNKLSCICVDKRSRDPMTGQYVVVLENGKRSPLPPNVHSVPALIKVKDGFTAIFGAEIVAYLQPESQVSNAVMQNGEPLAGGFASGGFAPAGGGSSFGGVSFSSGAPMGGTGYVSINHTQAIMAPPENYVPDKIGAGLTIEQLQQQRDTEIPLPPRMAAAFP